MTPEEIKAEEKAKKAKAAAEENAAEAALIKKDLENCKEVDPAAAAAAFEARVKKATMPYEIVKNSMGEGISEATLAKTEGRILKTN